MIYQLKKVQSRAANAENPTGERGMGGLTRNGRKGSPCIQNLMPGQTVTLMESEGPGMIRHIWCTFPPNELLLSRHLILRIYWDDQPHPSVEVPLGDFFGIAHARKRNMVSELFSFQNAKGLNCWVPMPFLQHARITVQNDGDNVVSMLFYQIDYTLGDMFDTNTAYFHAQFRRNNPCPLHEDYVILDGVHGRGIYLGTVLGVRSIYRESWWGEGEVKFYLDGEKHPTICGTGAEDYIGFAWGLGELCTPWQGCPLCDNELGLYSLYRLHTQDPIFFDDSIKVTIQQIGYGNTASAQSYYGEDFVHYQAAGAPSNGETCYFDRSDDICSVAYWYQTLPTAPFPLLSDKVEREADLMIEKEQNKTRRSDI